MNEENAADNRFNGTVAVWYSCHHHVTKRDWRNIEEFHGPYHPLLGAYKNDDPQTLRQHLQWIRRAGIDTIVYDMYGIAEMGPMDIEKDRVLPLLIHELANQEHESRKLQLIIWLEKYMYNPTLEEYRYALKYVREHLAEQDFYYRYKGRPLVVTYHNGPNQAIDEIIWENEYFNIQRIRPFEGDVWSYVEHYPQRLNKEWMVASPGFDPYLENAYIAKYVHRDPNPNFEQIRQDCLSFSAQRDGGEYYKKQLLRVRDGDPDIVFVSGWNDWQFALQIEPAEEYGFQYVDLTAQLLGRQAETASYRNL